MLDVRRLRLLREVKVRGTLAEVAAALNFSPSTVSQQLSLLEKEVGVELLRKAGRRVQLTPQAEILVAHTAEVLESLERAEAELAASLSSVTGTVRLAVFQSAALALIPGFLTIMGARCPEVRVEIVQAEPETALYETWARDFDLVIAEQYPGHAAPHHRGLDRKLLTTDAIRLALPPAHGLPGQGSGQGLPVPDGAAALAGAAALPWVMEPRGAASRHWAEQACRSAGFEPDVRFETADLQAHVRLIESGNAVALLPDLIWTGREKSVTLAELPGRPHRTVFTSTRQAGAKRPAIVAARKALAEAAATVAPPVPG